jgi:hypothetical protein
VEVIICLLDNAVRFLGFMSISTFVREISRRELGIVSLGETGFALGGDAGCCRTFTEGIDATVAWIAAGLIGGDKTVETTSGGRRTITGGSSKLATGWGGGLTSVLIEIAAAGLAGKAAAVCMTTGAGGRGAGSKY